MQPTKSVPAALLLVSLSSLAQDLSQGTAVVRLKDAEYTIPILCDSPSQPQLGFSTEPSRVTREATGRTSMVNVRLRSWKESGELIVTLNRYVAWLPAPTSAGGSLSMQLDMSPASIVRDNTPVALTYDMWTSGDRPQGLEGVKIDANCSYRDPDAPSYRR
jgi:hypothetical protein